MNQVGFYLKFIIIVRKDFIYFYSKVPEYGLNLSFNYGFNPLDRIAFLVMDFVIPLMFLPVLILFPFGTANLYFFFFNEVSSLLFFLFYLVFL